MKGNMKMTSISKTRLNKVVCIIGPSATGKSALTHELGLPEVVSYRTRKIRDHETDGVNGHFVTEEEFLAIQDKGLMIAETFYAGNYYGITQGEILQLEDSPMTYVIDWDGVITLRETFDKLEGYDPEQIISIFIHTDREDLKTRMIKAGRGKEEIKARLDRADRDYAASSKCDYVVKNVNGMLEKTAYEVMKIIMKETFSTEG